MFNAAEEVGAPPAVKQNVIAFGAISLVNAGDELPIRGVARQGGAVDSGAAVGAQGGHSPAFDDSDVLTESDFNLFDADHTSQDAL